MRTRPNKRMFVCCMLSPHKEEEKDRGGLLVKGILARAYQPGADTLKFGGPGRGQATTPPARPLHIYTATRQFVKQLKIYNLTCGYSNAGRIFDNIGKFALARNNRGTVETRANTAPRKEKNGNKIQKARFLRGQNSQNAKDREDLRASGCGVCSKETS